MQAIIDLRLEQLRHLPPATAPVLATVPVLITVLLSPATAPVLITVLLRPDAPEWVIVRMWLRARR